MGRRDQQPDECGRRLGRQRGFDLLGQFAEASRVDGGLRLLGIRLVQEPAERLRRLPECLPEFGQVLPLIGGEGPVTAEMVEDGAYQSESRGGIVEDQLGEQGVPLACQLLPQPGVGDLGEGKLRLVAVHHARAGVDIGFHRIGRDEALAETVNCRAGHLVERRVRCREIAPLLVREAPRQGDAKLGWNVAGCERAHKGPHPDEQLARGELGEGHSGDRLGAALPASSMAIRPAMTAVLPEPAPASTRKERSWAAMASRRAASSERVRRRAAITRRPRSARHPPGAQWPKLPCVGGRWRLRWPGVRRRDRRSPRRYLRPSPRRRMRGWRRPSAGDR